MLLGCITYSLITHLHIRASGKENSEVNNERTNHIFALPFVVLALEVVFQNESKETNGENGLFALTCTNICECLYAGENTSFAQRQRHTNVHASGEARYEHECVNSVLEEYHSAYNARVEKIRDGL